MAKIVLIRPDGPEQELLPAPASEMQRIMRKALGGDPEMVRVLDHIEPDGTFVLTAMFVNDDGLLKGLPRNEKATAIYQRLVRAQFSGPNPFEESTRAYLARFGLTEFSADLTPPAALAAGYKDDPWIAGSAIFFEGYTVDEVQRLLTEPRKGASK